MSLHKIPFKVNYIFVYGLSAMPEIVLHRIHLILNMRKHYPRQLSHDANNLIILVKKRKRLYV